MKNYWIIAIVALMLYMGALAGTTYYYGLYVTPEEKAAQVVLPRPINAKPISDEVAKALKERKKYGDWPININQERMGKFNPFRI